MKEGLESIVSFHVLLSCVSDMNLRGLNILPIIFAYMYPAAAWPLLRIDNDPTSRRRIYVDSALCVLLGIQGENIRC